MVSLHASRDARLGTSFNQSLFVLGRHQRGSSGLGTVHARVQLEIVGRHLLRPYRTSRNDRNGVGMPAPQRVVRTRLSDDLIIRSNFERPNPALGVGFSPLILNDPSLNRRSSGLPRPCRPLCRSVRRCLSTRLHTSGWILAS